MKQTFFIILISTLFLGSCSSTKDTKNIKTFEQTLGKDNSKALSNFVVAFENEILKKKYPSLETDKAYMQLLSEEPYSIAPMKIYNFLSDKSLKNFLQSQLWNEVYASVDSVWIENSELNSRFVYRSEDENIEVAKFGFILRDNMDRDSVVKREWNMCYFNHLGKYYQAINAIKGNNSFLKEFYSVKDNFGEISTGVFHNMIVKHKPNLNDYIIRRVVAIELGKYLNDARIVK